MLDRSGPIAFPRSRTPEDRKDQLYVSPRGGFGQYLRRKAVLGQHGRITLEETQRIIGQIFEALRAGGIVEQTVEPAAAGDPGGYQVNAAAMVWRAGEGVQGFHDPIRLPRLPETGIPTNPFFVDLYREIAYEFRGMSTMSVSEGDGRVYQEAPGSTCVPPYTDPNNCAQAYLGQPAPTVNGGTYKAHSHVASLDVLYRF